MYVHHMCIVRDQITLCLVHEFLDHLNRGDLDIEVAFANCGLWTVDCGLWTVDRGPCRQSKLGGYHECILCSYCHPPGDSPTSPASDLQRSPTKMISPLICLKHKVKDPHWQTRVPSLLDLLVMRLPVNLPASRVEIDLIKSQPPLSFPEIAACPEKHDHR